MYLWRTVQFAWFSFWLHSLQRDYTLCFTFWETFVYMSCNYISKNQCKWILFWKTFEKY